VLQSTYRELELNNTPLSLQQVVASGLSTIDVEYLSSDKSGAIEIEHRVYDVRALAIEYARPESCERCVGRIIKTPMHPPEAHQALRHFTQWADGEFLTS